MSSAEGRPFADHFSARSRDYATFRPTYPKALIAEIAALPPARHLAWDAGTGSGQAATLLAEHFERVVATDPSAKQLETAPAHPRIEYRLGREDESGLPNASVDLVTVAQALHWFDLDRFHSEVNRVLVSAGVLAEWCYQNPHIDATMDPLIEWFYADRVGRWWTAHRHHVESGYRELPFPFERLPVGRHAIERTMTREAFLGYVGTWSAVARCREAEGRDPVPELEARLRDVWRDDEERLVRWPISVHAGRRKSS